MPREIIGDRIAKNFEVNVEWSRDNYVQIGTAMTPPRTSKSPQNLAQLVEQWKEHDGDGIDTSAAMGLYVTLGREEINKLIRVLRRARDQAYGKDE